MYNMKIKLKESKSLKYIKKQLKSRTNTGNLIQVCYVVDEPKTKEREMKALLEAGTELSCSNLLVITWDYENQEIFKEKEIRFVPLWKWLLQ